MVLEPVLCPDCQRSDVIKHGQSAAGKQCYRCRNPECRCSAFVKHYSYPGYLPEVKQQITEMALNGSGIRDTAQVLSISPTTVIEELKKSRHLRQVNSKLLEQLPQHGLAEVVVERVEAVEMDEMWSFVGHRKHQRWLWHAIDPVTGKVLAYVLAPHTDAALESLMQLLLRFAQNTYR